MKKRQLGLGVLFFALMVLCACGAGSQNELDSAYIPKADEYYDETTSDAEKEANVSAIEVRYVEDFSSGRAWIKYEIGDQSNRYLGCIDKNGSLLFSFESDCVRKHVPFECGASYVVDRQGVTYIIDVQGKSLFSISPHTACRKIFRATSLNFLEIHPVFLRKFASRGEKFPRQSARVEILNRL